MRVVVELPIKTVSEANAHTHWRVRQRRAKTQRTAVGLHLLATETPRMMVAAPLVVTITRLAPSRGLDDDNLAGSAKHVRDGIADALGIDDRDPRVSWRYAQERGPWGIRICITTAAEEAAE